MKVVILAGGFGTRISEESHTRPKPMIEIGGKPILWHIMKTYSHFNFNEFIICCGYKGYMIKEYFANYFLHMSDVTFDMKSNEMKVHQKNAEPWKVTLVDTGENTFTGGRLKRVRQYLNEDEPFCFTYGDGVSNIDIKKELKFHNAHGKLATMSIVQPPGRYGALTRNYNEVTSFTEKPKGDGSWINGGFFILNTDVIDLIANDETIWESGVLHKLSDKGELHAFEHKGFWQSMDTLRDKKYLEDLWINNNAPWKFW